MYKLTVSSVVLERVDGTWYVSSPSLPNIPCKDFKTAVARMLLEASPVEWPDEVEDEVLDAVRALTKAPKSSTQLIEVDKDHPLAQPPKNVPVLPHVPGQMLEPVTIPPEEPTLRSFRGVEMTAPAASTGAVVSLYVNSENE